MIFVISAKQGAGKTTLAEHIMRNLPDTVSLKFAAPLYEMRSQCMTVLKRYGIRPNEVDKDIFQVLGNWARKNVSNNVFLDCLSYRLKEIKAQNFIVEDVRTEDEFLFLRGVGQRVPDTVTIRLLCPREIRKERATYWRENEDDITEIGLDRFADQGLFDYYFKTDKQTPDMILDYLFDKIPFASSHLLKESNRQAVKMSKEEIAQTAGTRLKFP